MGIIALITNIDASRIWTPIVLYIGPDAILPLTSALAAAGGVILMFWQRFVGVFRKMRRSAPPKE